MHVYLFGTAFAPLLGRRLCPEPAYFCAFGGCSGSCQRDETGRDFLRAGTFFFCVLRLLHFRASLRCTDIAPIRSGNRREKEKTATGGSRKKTDARHAGAVFVHTKGLCLMTQIYR